MLEKFLRGGNFSLLQKSIEEGESCSVFGLNIGEKIALLEDSAFLFYVVDSLDSVGIVFDKLNDLGRTVHVLTEEINPLTSPFESCENIIELLNGLKNDNIDTLIITPNVLCAKFPSPETIESINIKVGDELSVAKFTKQLVKFGYKRVDLVSEKGQFSVRGDVIDIYPLGASPIRIMTDFDVVESIRIYNPITLLTTSELDSCSILKNNYFEVSKEEIDEVYLNKKLRKDDLYYELLNFETNDYRLIAFDGHFNASIFDYVSGGIIAFDGAKTIYDRLENSIKNYKERINDSPLKNILVNDIPNINKVLNFDEKFTLVAFHYIQQNNRIFKPKKVFSIRTLPSVNYNNNWGVLLNDISNFCKNNYTTILCVSSNEQANKLALMLDKSNLPHTMQTRIATSQIGQVNIVTRKYPLDIILPEEKLAIISYSSLFGKPKKVIESEVSFFDGETPKEGDYVVHNLHGVGKCLGVKALTISEGCRDYVIIEYKNSDKVYLPVENLSQLSKYIGSDKTPSLNKIGGVEFSKTKEKIKSAVKKVAFDLITLYRDRMNLKGVKYYPDDEMQIGFEKSFPFSETADQLKAINDCKQDMETAKVMDRLVCGDVGFGKTEVALRIAFKTILNGKQVVFLCPTTILSEQHYNTAKARMSNFGVKIDVLNRLRTKSDEEKIKKDFSNGKIDMLCGTHKLLSNNIDYKNLGLLILDEEQKFGVADKEKIKNIKKHVNVLTLSATPIPRTLNMSLIGVRDISVIETPPVQRISCDVQVVELSDILLKTAISRELERNGQALVIFNSVEKIYNFASHLKLLVPTATISVAHGQMDAQLLEKEIYNLYTGKTQVLVATTLIENGVDLPNANTLIVIDSDKLGLSQLYQLKGRIGRSDKSSYAYFTFDNHKDLSETACKRLQAIKEFSEMGSGFKIAMRDLEIRGAGSLLGAEQSGHIEKLGYNMYVELLNESVKELRGESAGKKTDIRVETNLSAYLSHDYVASASIRMFMYKEISSIDTIVKFDNFIANTESVFGTLPEELINLCKIALAKNCLCKLGVTKLVIKSTIKLFFESKDCLNKTLIDAIHGDSDNVLLSMTDVPIVEIKTQKQANKLDCLIKFIGLLIKF